MKRLLYRLLEDLENGGWVERSFSPGRTFLVAV